MTILSGAGEADFLYLQREGGFTQGNLSGHLTRLEHAGYLSIEKRFKGKMPLTVCSLTGKGKAAFSRYSQSMLGILKSRDRSSASDLDLLKARRAKCKRRWDCVVSGREVFIPYIDPAVRGRCGPVSEIGVSRPVCHGGKKGTNLMFPLSLKMAPDCL